MKPPANSNQNHHRLLAPIILGIVVILLLVGALSRLSFEKLALGSAQPRAQLSAAKLESQLTAEASSLRLPIRYPDRTVKYFPLSAVGIEVDTSGSIQAAMRAHMFSPLYRRWQWWHTEQIPLILKVDNAQLENFINQNATIIVSPAQDATLTIDQGKLKLTPEVIGSGYIIPNARSTILTINSDIGSVDFWVRFNFNPVGDIFTGCSDFSVCNSEADGLIENFLG